jgi:hypothetical protein
MQATADSIMSEIAVACPNCLELRNQLSDTTQHIAQFVRSEWYQNAYYRELLNQQKQKYEVNLKEIAADRQKIYDDQRARLNDESKKHQIAEQSLRHEFICHQSTETILRDTRKALAHEQERNKHLLAIIKQHQPLTAFELNPMTEQLQALIDALQHTLKGPKEGGGEGDDLRGNKESDVE